MFYETSFQTIEPALFESGRWISGLRDGLDWTDINVTATGAHAYYTAVSYDDSIALLKGNWGPNQTLTAVVRSVNQNQDLWQEVEFRLRSTITAHNSTGYQVFWSCKGPVAGAYLAIAKWNGAFGDFTNLLTFNGAQYSVANGDTVAASVDHTHTFRAYKNGVLQMVYQGDTTYLTGLPGIGFNEAAIDPDTSADYGFTYMSASDGLPDPGNAAGGGGRPRIVRAHKWRW